MAATTKTALLAVTETEFAKLMKLVNAVPVSSALRKREEDTSIKDVIGHRAHWITLFLGWYAEGQAGNEVHFPAKGYKWNELRRYNTDLRARQSDLGWGDVMDQLKQNHEKLLGLIQSLPEEALYGGPMQGAKNSWSVGRWAEAAGPSHYRSAAKYIRACNRADG